MPRPACRKPPTLAQAAPKATPPRPLHATQSERNTPKRTSRDAAEPRRRLKDQAKKGHDRSLVVVLIPVLIYAVTSYAVIVEMSQLVEIGASTPSSCCSGVGTSCVRARRLDATAGDPRTAHQVDHDLPKVLWLGHALHGCRHWQLMRPFNSPTVSEISVPGFSCPAGYRLRIAHLGFIRWCGLSAVWPFR